MLLASGFPLSSGQLVLATIALPAVYFAILAIHRLYLHPLARFPGPLLHRISRIPYLHKHIRGSLPFDMLAIHEKYGNIVRIGPDELSFSHPDAWNDIMGHQKGQSRPELSKASWFYRPIEAAPTHIANEAREQHGRLRRQLAHGFSETAMREQEPLIQGYIDLLIRKLKERCRNGADSVVLSEWYNWFTFDVIGHLTFGEPFGCLERAEYDPWIKGIFQSGRIGTVLQALSFVPAVKKLLMSLIPQSVRAAHDLHKQKTKAKMMRRIEKGMGRQDLIEGLLEKQQELKLDVEQLVANAEILIIGGSETTATLLSGATYLILTNPGVLDRLVAEVRGAFEAEDEITSVSVNRLDYMLAVLNESSRMYPPVASGLPRIVPPEGAQILGEYVSGSTTVAVHHWSLYRRESYFRDADEFHPERFLGHERYKHDRRDALQPFSVGPRSCLGRNLAYAEMRLILARVLYNFDLRLADESTRWIEQKNFLMWQKGLLKVYLTPVVR